MVQQNGARELESINFFLYRLFTVINFAMCCLILKSFKCIQIKPSIKTVLKYYTVFRTKSAVLPARSFTGARAGTSCGPVSVSGWLPILV